MFTNRFSEHALSKMRVKLSIIYVISKRDGNSSGFLSRQYQLSSQSMRNICIKVNHVK